MSVPARRVAESAGADHPYRVVGRLIRQVTTSMMRRVDQRMQPLNLTAWQWQPLLHLSLGKVDTVAALARDIQVDCGAMTRMLDRLEDKGLVRRQRSETDRRVVHLHLTPAGRKVAQEIMPIVIEELGVHLRGFNKAELKTLTALLTRMVRNGAADA